MSNTVQIGIDLGTTNSAICINSDGKYSVIKNSDQMEYTPSVFGFNKVGNKQIGKKAYESLFQFPDEESVYNYKSEVKRLMGTNQKIQFKKVNQSLSAEEISSEILMYLKEAVLKKYPEFNTAGVVITVPAYFDTIQKEATKIAGELAGFSHVVLIQEPIAAAVAYGLDNKKNENRLVYDLGGGTFDVAVITSKDGVLTVKGHAGDNYLGGKDFDNLIVDNIIVPKLIESQYSFDSLNRNNEDTLSIYNVLKYYAENCKKELTDMEKTKIVIENIKDEDDEDVYLEIEITKKDFEALISKLIDKSIALCNRAIKDSGLSNLDITKIILVGGSTITPYIRYRLENDLKIQVDASVDPLTVVAKGACVFGGSQIVPDVHRNQTNSAKIGSVSLKLNYESMTAESDTMVTGIIEELDGNETDYYIQIQSDDGNYSSSKIKLKNGKFFDNILVSQGKTNDYFLYLTDSSGVLIPTTPDSFTIVHGLSIAGTPLSHTVSIALNKKTFLGEQNEEYCETIFPKGSILPLKKILTYRTTRNLKKGDNDNALPIKIYEGESKRVDRNNQICEIKLLGTEIPYNLPEGTEVNLTLEMTISGELNISVYFPSIDLYKSGKSLRTEGEQEAFSAEEMRIELEKENNRLDELSDHIPENQKNKLKEDIKDLYSSTETNDTDTQRKTHHKIKELKSNLDEHEKETQSDRLIQKFNDEILKSEELFNQSESPLEYKQTQSLKEEGNNAIKSKDREKLESINDAINGLRVANVMNSPEGMKYMLGILYEKRHESIDPIKSNEIFNRSLQYVENNNTEGMRSCVRELLNLLPQESQKGIGNISGISK